MAAFDSGFEFDPTSAFVRPVQAVIPGTNHAGTVDVRKY